MFLRNAWYVAALDRELGDRLLPLRILGEDIVLYRQANGVPAALEDACVHRKLPLSLGRIRGDHVECGYHGLTFNAAGECVRIPCADRIPKNARVRSYPLVSRYGLLWIWMGRAEAADPDKIFQVQHWGDPAWGMTTSDAMTVDCHYLYMTDNLLDPSHVAWVHPSSFGNAACEATLVEVKAAESGFIASRWMRDVEVAPLYVPFVRFTGHCDRLQHYEVRLPSHSLVKAVFVPAGSAGADAECHAQAFVMDSYNFLTPVSADQTRYFWFQMRNVFPNDEAVSRQMAEGVRLAFEEDRVILSAVHKNFARTQSPHIDIAIDSAPLRFRRRLRQLIEAEQALPQSDQPAAVGAG
jgi:phenylpropionate dioxygenase-like ring-hydroxylating dioxygenase large terminal subunit